MSSELHFKIINPKQKSGHVDLKDASLFLAGIQEITQKVVEKETGVSEFRIPITTKKGSWIVEIASEILNNPISTTATVAGLEYARRAASKAATDVLTQTGLFKDISIAGKTLSSVSLKIIWTLRIFNHKGQDESFSNISFKSDENLYYVTSSKGTMSIPSEYWKFYKFLKPKDFSKLAAVVDKDKQVEISFTNESEDKISEKITQQNKSNFIADEDLEEVLFPSMTDGSDFNIICKVSRLNQNSNTIGVEYGQHILFAKPYVGQLADYKKEMFSSGDDLLAQVKLKGVISRSAINGRLERKPTLIFTSITKISPQNKSNKIF